MKTTVLLDRVLVKKTEAEKSTSSGLLIASGLVNPQDEGIVVAVGEGRLTSKDVLVPIAIKVDDRVIFQKGAGIPVKIDGEELVVLREYEIYGVLEE